MVHITEKEGITITLPDFKSYEELYCLQSNLLKLLQTKDFDNCGDGTDIWYWANLLEATLLQPEQVNEVRNEGETVCYEVATD